MKACEICGGLRTFGTSNMCPFCSGTKESSAASKGQNLSNYQLKNHNPCQYDLISRHSQTYKMSIKHKVLNAVSAHPKLAAFGIALALTMAVGTAMGMFDNQHVAFASTSANKPDGI